MKKTTLLKELTKLNILYAPTKTADELHVVAQMWLEDLGHIPDDVFVSILSQVRKESAWFPLPARIEELYQEHISKPRHKEVEYRPDNPGGPSPEVMRKSIEELRDRLAKRFSM